MSLFKFKVEVDYKDIAKTLDTLEPRIAKRSVRRSQRVAMKPILKMIKDRFPVKTGEWKKSIKLRVGKTKEKNIMMMRISTDDDNFVPKWIEFGTMKKNGEWHIHPDPIWRETYEAELEPAADRALEALRAELEKLLNES